MKRKAAVSQLVITLVVPLLLVLTVVIGNKFVSVYSENAPLDSRFTVIIDAGHGGIDGGAVSCTGAEEQDINLQIALRLDDLFHLLGFQTKMLRSTPDSIETQGTTIAQKKISDLRERVKRINETQDPLVLSIHQNHFTDSRYSGAQVFYANTQNSDRLAQLLQNAFIQTLNPGSNRKEKKASGVYLMDKIQCTGVLIECGFLSNPQEEAKLRSDTYQKQLCCVIATQTGAFIQSDNLS